MYNDKKLEISEGIFAYYLMQHIFRTRVNPCFTREYLDTFLDNFLRLSEVMGYELVAKNGKVVKVDSDDFSKFVQNTGDLLIFKYAQKVDDYHDNYCISHEFVKPLRTLYETMPVAMKDCILNFEAALARDAYFNDNNLNMIENEYERQSEKLEKEYEKKHEKDDDFHCMA